MVIARFSSSCVLSRVCPKEKEDVESDGKVLADYSLMHEVAGAYRLHDLTHDYLQLHTKMTPDTVAVAVSRQAKFLVLPETLYTYTSEEDEDYGGLHALVRLWTTVKKLDRSRTVWDGVQKAGASPGWKYLREAGVLMLLVVRHKPACVPDGTLKDRGHPRRHAPPVRLSRDPCRTGGARGLGRCTEAGCCRGGSGKSRFRFIMDIGKSRKVSERPGERILQSHGTRSKSVTV